MVISEVLTGQLPLQPHQCPLCPKWGDEQTKHWRVTIQVCWWREQMKQISRAGSRCLNKATVLTSTTLRRQTTDITSLHLSAAQHIWHSCTVRAALAAVHRMHFPSPLQQPLPCSHHAQRGTCCREGTAGALLTPTSPGFALESCKANLVHHTAAGCWILSPSSRWDEFHKSVLCAHQRLDGTHWDLPAAAKEKNMWHDPPQNNIWNFWHWTQSISKHLWKRK